MDPYLRRAYLSVAGVLFILWMGMLIWFVKAMKPEFLSFASAPALPISATFQEITPLLHVPGIHFSIYHTLPGDTFLSVAQKFKLSETTIRSLNQANDNTQPKSDTLLFLPSKDGIFYVMRPGQGMADIARAYGIS